MSRCTDPDCEQVRHCPRCGGHLDWSDYRCPVCVSKARRDLRAIEDLAAAMPVEAQHRGVTSEAAYLAGPVTNPERFMWKRIAQSRAGHDVEEWDLLHPLTCLGHWEMIIRDDLAPDTHAPDVPTVAASRDYLDRALTQLVRDEARAVVFDELADDLRRLRRHLEGVLRDGDQVERGAPCPSCPLTDERKQPALVHHYAAWDLTGAADWWQCPVDGEHQWVEADYRRMVGADYLLEASALTAADIERAYRINPATLRSWAHRGIVATRGRDASGRQLYDVAQAKQQREATASGPAAAEWHSPTAAS